MKAPLSYVPALPASIGVMAGIVLYYSDAPIWLCIILITLFVAVTVGRRMFWGMFLCIFAFLGLILAQLDDPKPPSAEIFDRKACWKGEVTAVNTTSSSTRLRVTVDGVANGQQIFDRISKFRCSVLMPAADTKFRCGDIVEFEARMLRPESRTDLPDENSMNPTYFVDGVCAEAYVSPDRIETVASVNNLRRVAEEWHEHLQSLIFMSPVSSNTAWFLDAALLGDDSMLAPDVKQNFRSTGVAHYLALSGFHVGIIAMLAGLILFPLKAWSRVGRYRHLIVIALIWFYAFTCGLSASLVRAATLISIFLIAKLIGRQSSPYNSLAVAAVIILIFSPRQLFAPGFQMSFAAVLSILAFAPALNPFGHRKNKAYRVAEFFTVPIAAMLGTCLISMLHFHRFPLLFLLPNLLLGVLMPLLLGAGIIMMAATACGIRLSLLGACVDGLYMAAERFCDFLADIPHAEITGLFLPPVAIIAGISAIACLAVSIHFKKRHVAILCIAALVAAVGSTALQAAPPQTELFITRQPLRTDIIVRHAENCHLITNAPEKDHRTIARQLGRRYTNYLHRRHCGDSLKITNGDFNTPAICRSGDYIVAGNRLIAVAISPSVRIVKDMKTDYLLISRAAGGKPEQIVDDANPDTVLIAADMPPKRTIRLKEFCTKHGHPFIDLHKRSFSLSFN